ncbi:MAG: hypothetical protein VKJ05_00205 [Synechococcaceae cyanobacterium]|nr:hypothetical protein [Synechococcaceae cyanobacterium]
MVLPLPRALALALPLALFLPLSPGLAPLALASGGGDPSRRFPLRREGGGTRGACAARLLVHLVPPEGHVDPGPDGILGVIEAEAPRQIPQPRPESRPNSLSSTGVQPLVLRWPAGEWIAPARPGASLRLLRLAGLAPQGEWFSFPACEGSADPVAPPPSSQLRPSPGGAAPAAAAARAADARSRAALAALWRQCGAWVDSAPLLAFWGFADLAGQLPARLPVVCAVAPPTAPRSPLPAAGR